MDQPIPPQMPPEPTPTPAPAAPVAPPAQPVQAPPSPTAAPTPPPHHVPFGLAVTIIVLVAALALGGVLLYFNQNGGLNFGEIAQNIIPSPASSASAPAPSPTATLEKSDDPDVQKVDQSLNDLDKSAQAADTGLNDKPGDLSE